jgi:hypothetical protein
MDERWRWVPACRWYGIPPAVFQVSSEGRVKVRNHLRSGTPDKDGYLRVKFQGRWFSVHMLVCVAFHGLPQVRHVNGDRQVNTPRNVEWGSKRENEQDKRSWKEEGSGDYPPVSPVTEVTGGLAG